MSANPVSDDLINFLLAAAMHCGRTLGNRTASFAWCRQDGTMAELTPDSVRTTGQMLREENVNSLLARHENPWKGEPPPMGFPTEHLIPIGQMRPGEVLKATDYYEYQTSRHQGWWESDAREFIECLRRATWMLMPEYRRARWGEPEHVRSYYRATPAPSSPPAEGTGPGREGFREKIPVRKLP